MNIAVIAAVVGVIALTYVIVEWKRDSIERSYERGKLYRELVTAIAAAIVGWTFIRSGDPALVAVAVMLFAFATLYFVIEQPHKEVI